MLAALACAELFANSFSPPPTSCANGHLADCCISSNGFSVSCHCDLVCLSVFVSPSFFVLFSFFFPSLGELVVAPAVFHFRLFQTLLLCCGFFGQGCPQVRSYTESAEESHAIRPSSLWFFMPCAYVCTLTLPGFLSFFLFSCWALPGIAAILMWPRFAAFIILQDWADLWPHLPVASTLGPRPQTFLANLFGKEMIFLRSSGSTYNLC